MFSVNEGWNMNIHTPCRVKVNPPPKKKQVLKMLKLRSAAWTLIQDVVGMLGVLVWALGSPCCEWCNPCCYIMVPLWYTSVYKQYARNNVVLVTISSTSLPTHSQCFYKWERAYCQEILRMVISWGLVRGGLLALFHKVPWHNTQSWLSSPILQKWAHP